MGGFMDKAKDFADQHDEQVDQGLEKAGDAADQRTGGGHGEQIDRGVDIAQERTGEGDTQALIRHRHPRRSRADVGRWGGRLGAHVRRRA